MKIVIIGGAGFIGHHAAIALKNAGHEVTIIDSLMVNNYYAIMGSKTGNYELYLAMIDERQRMLKKAKVPILMIDARDYGMLNLAINPLAPDVIVHMSAVSNIVSSNKDPFSTFGHNLRTLENALDIARNGHPHFIYLSSSTVYGAFSKPILDEEASCKPFGIYGALKLAGEHIVRAHSDVYGMTCTIIRPCALYGPRCVSGRVGQKFIERAMIGKPITVFGDGEIYEDFTFVDDFVDGLKAVIDNRDLASGQTFNITAGEAHSLNELANIVASHYGVMIEHGPADPEKPHRGTLDIFKARSLLGYRPKYDLWKGMAKYLEWYDALRANRGGADVQ